MNRTALLAVVAILSFTSCSKERRPKEIYHEGMGAHGMPSDWKSTVSKGSLTEGRKLFVELECYKCHEVIGESFLLSRKEKKELDRNCQRWRACIHQNFLPSPLLILTQ